MRDLRLSERDRLVHTLTHATGNPPTLGGAVWWVPLAEPNRIQAPLHEAAGGHGVRPGRAACRRPSHARRDRPPAGPAARQHGLDRPPPNRRGAADALQRAAGRCAFTWRSSLAGL
jgi:hypothetical protein